MSPHGFVLFGSARNSAAGRNSNHPTVPASTTTRRMALRFRIMYPPFEHRRCNVLDTAPATWGGAPRLPDQSPCTRLTSCQLLSDPRASQRYPIALRHLYCPESLSALRLHGAPPPSPTVALPTTLSMLALRIEILPQHRSRLFIVAHRPYLGFEWPEAQESWPVGKPELNFWLAAMVASTALLGTAGGTAMPPTVPRRPPWKVWM